MNKEPTWIVLAEQPDHPINVAVGNCDEIAIYLYSKRIENSHRDYILEKWKNIYDCSLVLVGREYSSWDLFLDAFELEETEIEVESM